MCLANPWLRWRIKRAPENADNSLLPRGNQQQDNKEKEKDFLDWYINAHLPDCVATQDYQGARLYRAAAPEISNGRGKFLAIYFIETDDISKTMGIRKARRQVEIDAGRGSDTWRSIWGNTLYRQIAECLP